MKEAKKKKIKGQTWSIDMSIGVVIFLLLLVLVYVLANPPSGSDTRLRVEADRVYSRIDSSSVPSEDRPGVIDGRDLNEEELDRLAQHYEDPEGYTHIRSLLGIEGDFCLVIVDEFGGIKNISSSVRSIGNPDDGLVIGKDSDGNDIICGE